MWGVVRPSFVSESYHVEASEPRAQPSNVSVIRPPRNKELFYLRPPLGKGSARAASVSCRLSVSVGVGGV